MDQVKKVARKEVERVERVVESSSSGRAVVSLAAKDHSSIRSTVRGHNREKAQREKGMGQRTGVGIVVGHTSATSAHRDKVQKGSLARSDHLEV